MKRFLCVLICVCVLCCGCGYTGNQQRMPVQSIDTAMGTIISQTVYADGTDVTNDILTEITNLEQELLSWRLDTSEVYKLNAAAGREPGIALSEELGEILTKCIEVSDASEGAFDITVGEVVRLWDIDSWAGEEDLSGYRIPGGEEIKTALASTGYEKLVLQENHLTISKDMQLDLGAVGKGIALDTILEYLETQGNVTGAVISVGGSILTYGQKPDGSAWKVGVVNPHDTSQNIGYLTLEGQWCVSTSGDYERFVEVNGVRYHHIIDSATGYPADSGLSSVTILTEDGLLSDALSTACFILGPEKGRDLVKQFGAEALFVDKEGNITMTAGMEQYFN